MQGHPSFDILGSESRALEGKTIVLGITGSVAAVRASDIARTLMRAGAHVYPVMSAAAARLIHPDLMEWATGHKPVLELSGAIEHVDLVGNVPVHADLILIAPATANTLSKVACGIDDTPVTTMVTTGFGEGIPLLMVPAMHQSMYHHPIVRDNIAKLESYGVHIMMPRIEEGKAKIPGERDILDRVVGILHPRRPLAGKRVIVSAGRTVEYLDPIRTISNNSTGKMGFALARAARDLGAEVCVVYGRGTVVPPADMTVVHTDTADDMKQAIEERIRTHGMDIYVGAAAVGDWKPVKTAERKIDTHGGQRLVIELEPTVKIIDGLRDLAPQALIVAFRAQANLDDAELEKDGKARLTKARADFIAINDTRRPGQGFEGDTNALQVWHRDGRRWNLALASKDRVAAALWEILVAEVAP